MKKVLLALLSVVLIFVFTGCSDNQTGVEKPVDFDDMEIGTQLQTYPDYEFEYAYTSGDKQYKFTIQEFKVELCEKNTIEQGEMLDGEFYPYAIKMSVKGFVDKELAGNKFCFNYNYHNSSTGIYVNCYIDENGNFDDEYIIKCYEKEPCIYYFVSISHVRDADSPF